MSKRPFREQRSYTVLLPYREQIIIFREIIQKPAAGMDWNFPRKDQKDRGSGRGNIRSISDVCSAIWPPAEYEAVSVAFLQLGTKTVLYFIFHIEYEGMRNVPITLYNLNLEKYKYKTVVKKIPAPPCEWWPLDFFFYDLLRKIFFRSFDLASLLYFTLKKRAVLTLEFDIFLACFKFAMLFTNFFCNYLSDVWVKIFWENSLSTWNRTIFKIISDSRPEKDWKRQLQWCK